MEAWLAQDNYGAVFAYSNKPKSFDGFWLGSTLFYVFADNIPSEVKALLKQQKAVRVNIHLMVTKIEQLPY